MRNADDIKRIFDEAAVETNPSKDEKILENITAAYKQTNKAQPEKGEPNIWRTIMKSPITKLAAAAVIITMVVIGINRFGIDGSGEVFAAAIDSIRKARIFSCIESFEAARENDEKYVFEQMWMFKEPDLERHICISGVDDRFIGQVTITHYGERKQIVLNPIDKTAILYDKSSDYVVDPETGNLILSQLDISLRDRLLELSVGAVKDLGEVKLEGELTQMLQSELEDRVITVWINPKTKLPRQIEIEWPGQQRTPVSYKSIQIDKEIDDNLFSLEPPESYQFRSFINEWPANKKKMSAKMMHLLRELAVFMEQNNGEYAKDLTDLEKIGLTKEVLNVILAEPDKPNGPAVIQYRQPRQGSNWSTEVVLYEMYPEWPDEGVVLGFADQHCEFISDPQIFEKLVNLK